jgi:hypothetical protein
MPARPRRTGNWSPAGGRVLNVTALGKTVTEARERAYEAVDRIDWPQGFCRRDIGWRAVERESREMAADEEREHEALEWSEGTVSDVADEPR